MLPSLILIRAITNRSRFIGTKKGEKAGKKGLRTPKKGREIPLSQVLVVCLLCVDIFELLLLRLIYALVQCLLPGSIRKKHIVIRKKSLKIRYSLELPMCMQLQLLCIDDHHCILYNNFKNKPPETSIFFSNKVIVLFKNSGGR